MGVVVLALSHAIVTPGCSRAVVRQKSHDWPSWPCRWRCRRRCFDALGSSPRHDHGHGRAPPHADRGHCQKAGLLRWGKVGPVTKCRTRTPAVAAAGGAASRAPASSPRNPGRYPAPVRSAGDGARGTCPTASIASVMSASSPTAIAPPKVWGCGGTGGGAASKALHSASLRRP